jgi:hypothetical protein
MKLYPFRLAYVPIVLLYFFLFFGGVWILGIAFGVLTFLVNKGGFSALYYLLGVSGYFSGSTYRGYCLN